MVRGAALTAAMTLAMTTPAAAAPSVAVGGAKAAGALRMCGASHPTQQLSASARATVRIARAPRALHALRIDRCLGGRWSAMRSIRVHGGAARLPALVAGGYRVVGAGLPTVYLRVLSPTSVRQAPLLDRATVRAPMVAFCDGPNGHGPRKPASTPLPVDPRTLVNAHLKDAGAVHYNAAWIPVHDAPGMRKTPFQYPTTCGAFRKDAALGRSFLYTRQMFQIIGDSAGYENLWRVWGLSKKPADFDQEVQLRYGLSPAPFRNPFPKDGEDPVKTKGGSGQLPLGLIQGMDEATGKPNGKITIACAACHDSILGRGNDSPGFFPGRGSDSFDASLFAVDLLKSDLMLGHQIDPGGLALDLAPYPYSAGRGLTNAFGLVDLMGLGDMETLEGSPGLEFFPDHGAAGQVQTPNWWNASHRTRMFLQGELSRDNTRVSMALAISATQRTAVQNKALEPKFENVHVFFDSLSPPRYPGKVDTKLAEEGAVLFHDKDLWADPRNRDIPRPPGNGSCASCHGVYSPRFADDKSYLPDPRLKGIEANITPLNIIRTDPARTHLVNDRFKRAWDTSWWAYNELNPKWTKSGQGQGGPKRLLQDYGVVPDDRVEGPNKWSNDPNGYEAPPLYGVWGSAPYFHNGSVPTIRAVLQPSKRPAVWRRLMAKPSESGIVQGPDPSIAGYDLEDLGYRYQTVSCGEHGVDAPLVPCHPHGSALSVVEGEMSKLLGPDLWLANQDPLPVSEEDRQRRMIYNTHEYSLGNGGHEFTRVLSDHEVDAILEYLKTL